MKATTTNRVWIRRFSTTSFVFISLVIFSLPARAFDWQAPTVSAPSVVSSGSFTVSWGNPWKPSRPYTYCDGMYLYITDVATGQEASGQYATYFANCTSGSTPVSNLSPGQYRIEIEYSFWYYDDDDFDVWDSRMSDPVTVLVNPPPSISLTAPSNGTQIKSGSSVTISANASDSGGSISSVKFYTNGSLFYTDTSSPYSVSWTPSGTGNKTVYALATDNHGATKQSTTNTIYVSPYPNVSLTAPSQGAVYNVGNSVSISANASDDGSISQVQFYVNGSLQATDTSSPYSTNWTAPANPGNYTIYSKATDNLGAQTQSNSISIIVNGLPSISQTSPSNGSVYNIGSNVTLSANASDDGSISKVEFFVNGSLYSTDTTYAYSRIWNAANPGSYTIYSKATDNHGVQTQSNSVTITVNANPSTSITAPPNSAQYPLGNNVSISASAGDSDGTISSVKFYGDGSLLATDTSSPYSTSWSPGSTGNHTIYSVVTDNHGATKQSSSVTFYVSSNPSISLTSPANGTVYNYGDIVNLSANASDDGSIAKVEFFVDGSLYSTDTTHPYSRIWTAPSSPGNHSFYAKVTDNLGVTTNSSSKTVTINAPPTGSLTAPANGAQYPMGNSINISANANDSDSSISSVKFYGDGGLLTTDTTSPYSTSWTPASAGNHSISAVITDNHGATYTTNAVTVYSSPLPTAAITSPANGVEYPVGNTVTITATASDDGSISKVEFYADGNYLGDQTTPPYQYHWIPTTLGNHSLYVKAFDNLGASKTSATITIVAAVNAAPSITMTSPSSNLLKALGDSIALSATAADTDGTISRVQFFANGTLVSEQTSSPYQTNWTPSNSGSYDIFARAIDNAGNHNDSPTRTAIMTVYPTTSLTAPANNSVHTLGDTVVVRANANDSDGSISHVQFFANGSVIADDVTSPYEANWNPSSAGSYTLMSKVFDNVGASTESAMRSVLINTRPSVTLNAPSNGTHIAFGDSIALSATASDSDGNIAKVQFIANGTVVSEQTSTPYQTNWTPATAGSYSIIARAIDNHGAQQDSSTATITVNKLPNITLVAPTGVQTPPITLTANANDPDGTVSQVKFFDNGNLIGTDNTSPYQMTWNPDSPGVHSITATATDNLGYSRTSASISIDVNFPPEVSLTEPSASSIFDIGTPIQLTANASDNSGGINTVEFFANGNYLGENTASPYHFSWNPTIAGTYTLKAKATDQYGVSSESSAITVTLNAPPSAALTSPVDGVITILGETVSLSATASDSDGSVSKVQFLVNGNVVAEDTSSPYQANWEPKAGGQYSVYVKAIDNYGSETTTESVVVNVNAPPSTTITAPGLHETYIVGEAVNIKAVATDQGGNITKVRFYANGSLLGEDTDSPYSLSWTPSIANVYSLQVIATDDLGVNQDSMPVSIKIIDLPLDGLTGPYTQGDDRYVLLNFPRFIGSVNVEAIDTGYWDSRGGYWRYADLQHDCIDFIPSNAGFGEGVYFEIYTNIGGTAFFYEEFDDGDGYIVDANFPPNHAGSLSVDTYCSSAYRSEGLGGKLSYRIPASPAVPSGFSSIVDSDGTVTLNWNSVGNAPYYEVHESKDGGLWTSVYSDGADTSITLDNRKAGSQYTYRLRAYYKAAGVRREGGFTSNQTVAIPIGTPSSLTGPMVSDNGDFTLSWNGVLGTIAYYEFHESGPNGVRIFSTGDTESRYRFFDQAAGTYEYKVRACGDNNCGSYSNTHSITVLNSDSPTPPVIDPGTDPANDPLEGEVYFGTLQGKHQVSRDGSFSYRIPIQVPPGINGVQPNLSLAYHSNGRNGIVGWGWGLSGASSSISRCSKNIARDGKVSGINTGDDYAFCLDGARLVEIAPNEYRTESESFSRIRAIGGSTKVPEYWHVESKDGTYFIYGEAGDGPTERVDSSNSTLRWFVREQGDVAGNYLTHHYEITASGMQRIDYIDYTHNQNSLQGTNHRVEFAYEDRDDVKETYVAGSKRRVDQRLSAIIVKTNGNRLRQYNLVYQELGEVYDGASYDDPVKTSRLYQVTLCFKTDAKCAEPAMFKWSTATTADYEVDPTTDDIEWLEDDVPLTLVSNVVYGSTGPREPGYPLLHGSDSSNYEPRTFALRGDFDGDGLKEAIWAEDIGNPAQLYISMGEDDTPQQVGTASSENRGGILDFNSDGLDDYYEMPPDRGYGLVVYISDGTGLYLSSQDGGYSVPASELKISSSSYGGWHIVFKDLNGDGLVDLYRTPRVFSHADGYDNPFHPLYGFPSDISVAINTGVGFGPFQKWGNSLSYQSAKMENQSSVEYLNPVNHNPLPLADVNGDGLPDIVKFYPGIGAEVGLNRGNRFEYQDWGLQSVAAFPNYKPPEYNGISPIRKPGYALEHTRLGDFNGDGLSDIVFERIYRVSSTEPFVSDGLWVALSTGAGFAEPSKWSDDGFIYSRISVMDVNRDGLSDMVHSSAVRYATLDSFTNQYVLYNHTTNPDGGEHDPENGMTRYTDAQLTENGDPVVIAYTRETGQDSDPRWTWDWRNYRAGPELNQILSVTEGNVRAIEVSYAPTNANTELYTQTPPSQEIGRPPSVSQYAYSHADDPLVTTLDHTKPTSMQARRVVDNIVVKELGQERARSDYHYTNARVHPAGWGNLGFQKVERTDTIPGETQQLRTISEYHQLANSEFKLTALMQQQRCVVDAGEVGCGTGTEMISETRNNWKVRVYKDDLDGDYRSPHYFPYIFQEETKSYDTITGTLVGTVFKRLEDDGNVHNCSGFVSAGTIPVYSDFHFDAFGTPLQVTESHCDVFGVQGTRTENTNITRRVDPWVLGLIQDPFIHTWNYNADTGEFDTKTRHSHFVFDRLGRVEEETREPNGSADQWLRQHYTYNGYGSVKDLTDTVRDFTNDGIAFTERTLSVNENIDGDGVRTVYTINPLGHRLTQIFDAEFGNEIATEDANGFTISRYFDDLGRLTNVYNPDGTQTQIDYRRCNGCFSQQPAAAWYTQSKTTGLAATRSYHDGLGREVGSRIRGLNGDFSYTATYYNDRGLVEKTREPFRSGDPVAETVVRYDIFGRTIQTDFPNGGMQTVDYQAREDAAAIKTTDSLGNSKTQRFDALIREKTIDDAFKTRVSYRHDAHGNVVWIQVLPEGGTGLVHTIEYDLLGRKTQLNDPDVGIIRYTYNALGLLATQTSAENETIHYHYDQLDRQIARIDAANGSAKIQRWQYDNQEHGLGLLGDVIGYDTAGKVHQVHYRYDELNRLTDTTQRIDGQDYTFSQHYDDYSRVSSVTYPTGFQLIQRYNAYGFQHRSDNALTNSPLWQATSDDARGNVTVYDYGNGVTTTKQFDHRTGLIQTIHAAAGGNVVQNHEYSFDTEGNLLSRIDYHHGVTQTFCYDDLYRLVDNPTSSGCSDVTGMDYATARHGYDAHGNILKKDNIGDYQYGTHISTGAGPHAVTYANGSDYFYDNAGRMTRGGGRNIQYSAFGKPTHMGKGSYKTDIVYGALQNRIKRIDDEAGKITKTIYVDKLYEKVEDNGQIEHRHYVGDFAVHIIKAATDTQYTVYQHRDHIGSIAAKTDDKDGSLTIRFHANEPWGRRQETHWGGQIYETLSGTELDEQTYATARGFTDHEHLDGVGLIHMNGRVYDPIVGRFVSPDPWIQDPENSQSFNRYSYVWNNPLKYTDPTGEVTLNCDGVTDSYDTCEIEKPIKPPKKIEQDDAANSKQGKGHDGEQAIKSNDDQKNVLQNNNQKTVEDLNSKPSVVGTDKKRGDTGTTPKSGSDQGKYTPENPATPPKGRVINVDAAVDYANANAQCKPTGKCATAVRKALMAGGAKGLGDAERTVFAAKDYDKYLKDQGWKNVSKKNYKPQKGDVVVFQPPSDKQKYGHIQIYNGSSWVSDFKQKYFKVWVKDANYTIHRP